MRFVADTLDMSAISRWCACGSGTEEPSCLSAAADSRRPAARPSGRCPGNCCSCWPFCWPGWRPPAHLRRRCGPARGGSRRSASGSATASSGTGESGVGPTRWFEDRAEAAWVLAGIVLLAAFFRLAALKRDPDPHPPRYRLVRPGREGDAHPREPGPLRPRAGLVSLPAAGAAAYTVSSQLLRDERRGVAARLGPPGILLGPPSTSRAGLVRAGAATIAALYLASSHVAVHFSRDGIWNIHSLALGVIGFGALFGGWRRRSGLWLGVSGVALGLWCLYTYTAGGGLVLRPRRARGRRDDLEAEPADVASCRALLRGGARRRRYPPPVASYARVPVALSVDQSRNMSPFSEAMRSPSRARSAAWSHCGSLPTRCATRSRGS